MKRAPAARHLIARIVFVVLMGATTLLAADDNTVIFPASAARAETKGAQATGSGALTLIAAVALAGVGAWFVWRGRRRTNVPSGTRHLVIDETRSLGSRQYLIVASYDDKKFLLGVCPGRIDLLTPLTSSAAEDFRQ